MDLFKHPRQDLSEDEREDERDHGHEDAAHEHEQARGFAAGNIGRVAVDLVHGVVERGVFDGCHDGIARQPVGVADVAAESSELRFHGPGECDIHAKHVTTVRINA